jgi:hypothetical protein
MRTWLGHGYFRLKARLVPLGVAPSTLILEGKRFFSLYTEQVVLLHGE